MTLPPSVFVSRKGLLIVFFIFAISTHDFIFNSVFYDSILYYLAAWKDIAVLFFVGFIFLNISKYFIHKRAIQVKSIFHIKLMLIFFFVALLSFSSLYENISNFRFYFLLIFFPLLLSSLLCTTEASVKYFLFALIVSVVFIIIYALFQYLTIEKEEDFWYWNHFINLGYEQNKWDVFRDGEPRVSSVFTSSLDFSLFLLSCLSFFIVTMYLAFKNAKFVRLFLSIFLIIGTIFSIHISTVRSAMIGAVLMVMLFIVFLLFKKKTLLFTASLSAFLLPSIITFYYIATGHTDDLSALGRISQWLSFIEIIKDHMIFGLGISQVGIKGKYWFDSFWINYFLSFGLLFGLILLGFFLRLFNYALNGLVAPKNNLELYTFLSLYLLTPVFFYLFIFQSFSRTPALYVFFTLFFVTYILSRKDK